MIPLWFVNYKDTVIEIKYREAPGGEHPTQCSGELSLVWDRYRVTAKFSYFGNVPITYFTNDKIAELAKFEKVIDTEKSACYQAFFVGEHLYFSSVITYQSKSNHIVGLVDESKIPGSAIFTKVF